MYQFDNENVSGTRKSPEQRDINPDMIGMESFKAHASGSPGIWDQPFQL